MGVVIRRSLYLIINLLLISSLTIGFLPYHDFSSADSMALSFDVWTNKGGKGPISPGGTFQVGEETVIYATATADVNARWTISGPSLSEKGAVAMLANKTYSFSMGDAQSGDVGQWTVVFEGELYKNGVAYQGAMDKVIFNVVAAGGGGAAPGTSQAAEPAADRPIDEDGAIEMDAVTALKMAGGVISPDPGYDVNDDGSVTGEDAQQIMYWAVNGVQQGLPFAEQQEVLDTFGPPAQFVLWYDLDDDTMMDFLVRNEVWYYPDYESCITFVAGSACGVGSYSPPENEAEYPDVMPWDFDGFMTYGQVMDKLGQKASDTLDLIPQSLQGEGFIAYAAGQAAFIMEGDQLAYIQTIGTEKGAGLFGFNELFDLPVAQFMDDLETAVVSLNPLAPQPAMARISFKKFGKWMVRNVKRGARTVVAVPQKVARIFPKPLRPIARMYLETQMGNLRIYKVAAKVNDVATLEKNRREWADACNKQAAKIDGDVQKLQQEKNKLETQRPSDLGMTFSQWKERYTLIKGIIPKLEDVSSKLRDNGRAFNTGDLLRIGTTQLVNSTLRNIEKSVTQKASEEFNRRVEQSSVRKLLEIPGTGTRIDNIVDLFINGRIAKILKEMGTDPEFKSKVEQAVKGELKKGKANLKEIDKLIANAVAKLNKESEKLLSEAEGLQQKVDKGGGGTTAGKGTDLSRYESLTFYILIDSFKLSDGSQQSWSLKADMPGKFTGNTFEGYESFRDEKGADITWEFKGTLSEDNKKLASFTMDYLRVTPAKGGIQSRRTEAHITAKNIDVRKITAENIWCYTASPTASTHSTSIKYSTQYGTSSPDKLAGIGCKQSCWIDISFLAK